MEEKINILKRMLAKANEKLKSAEALFSKEYSFSSHSQTIGKFNKEFIYSGVFPKSYSKEIHFLFDKRESGDYDIDSSINEEITARCLNSAKEIVKAVEQYLENWPVQQQ